MSPLKITIASLVVGLIGLTASAMPKGERGKSPAEPSYMRLVPLTTGLTWQDLFENLDSSRIQVYRTNAGYFEKHLNGSSNLTRKGRKRSKNMPRLFDATEWLLRLEKSAIASMLEKAQDKEMQKKLKSLLQANEQRLLKERHEERVRLAQEVQGIAQTEPQAVREDQWAELSQAGPAIAQTEPQAVREDQWPDLSQAGPAIAQTEPQAAREDQWAELSQAGPAIAQTEPQAAQEDQWADLSQAGPAIAQTEPQAAQEDQWAELARQAQWSELAQVALAMVHAKPQAAQAAVAAQPAQAEQPRVSPEIVDHNYAEHGEGTTIPSQPTSAGGSSGVTTGYNKLLQ